MTMTTHFNYCSSEVPCDSAYFRGRRQGFDVLTYFRTTIKESLLNNIVIWINWTFKPRFLLSFFPFKICRYESAIHFKTEFHLNDCKFESAGRRKWTDKRTTKNLQKNRTKCHRHQRRKCKQLMEEMKRKKIEKSEDEDDTKKLLKWLKERRSSSSDVRLGGVRTNRVEYHRQRQRRGRNYE